MSASVEGVGSRPTCKVVERLGTCLNATASAVRVHMDTRMTGVIFEARHNGTPFGALKDQHGQPVPTLRIALGQKHI